MAEGQAWQRKSPDGVGAEDATDTVGVKRPVARRPPAPLAQAAAVAEQQPAAVPSFSTVPSDTLSNPARHRWRSAWAKYESPGTSGSPRAQPPRSPSAEKAAGPSEKGVSPPVASSGALAAHAAAKRLWEGHAAAESDTTDTREASPDSPDAARGSSGAPQPPQQQLPGPWPLLAGAGLSSMQEAYINTLRAALGNTTAVLDTSAGRPSAEPSASVQQLGPAALQSGGLPRLPMDRTPSQNGSLSILPEGFPRNASAPALQSQAGPQAAPAASLAHIARLSQQLGEMLRGQSLAPQPSAQLPILASEPQIFGGSGAPSAAPMNARPHPSFARYSSEDSLRDHYSGLDLESLRSEAAFARAERGWSAADRMASDVSMHASSNGSAPPGPLPNLTPADSQRLMQSIQLLHQANEMAALASSSIQAFSMAANANLEGLATGGMRKRKHADFYDDAPKRHNSLLSEGESYPFASGQPQQMCAECGTTSTPTWRRSGKRLMCNACGLRRSRSIRSARSNSAPISPALAAQDAARNFKPAMS